MGLLEGKRGIVMGVANDHSIAWGIAKKLSEQGADLCFTYQGETLLRRIQPLAESINNNFFISIIGSFLVGFFISRKLSDSTEKILLSGFFSCFTSFSGFIYFLYTILNQGDWIKFIIFFNLIIIVNLFTMLFGFFISRKIT